MKAYGGIITTIQQIFIYFLQTMMNRGKKRLGTRGKKQTKFNIYIKRVR